MGLFARVSGGVYSSDYAYGLAFERMFKSEGSKARNAIRVSTMDKQGTVVITGH